MRCESTAVFRRFPITFHDRRLLRVPKERPVRADTKSTRPLSLASYHSHTSPSTWPGPSRLSLPSCPAPPLRAFEAEEAGDGDAASAAKRDAAATYSASMACRREEPY
ncbi:hypothetical protein ISF_08703 [Cordyceps fumosorosea ARSEF 2679]|uniref:Uncharacterized protein n=1 Tax=Cordyceps fumosorosea (strain ARSEF 2679) TaxID=1081104 RepID=A0A167LUZ6_CORFA|nr:hypothetical protein ISF_08703 [Cordyceps fumosorosea ARSEF 2679]OAA53542.1 hypothetical protein ISF_08703 [Cordyceps fumosorosea ARSEF 2679]